MDTELVETEVIRRGLILKLGEQTLLENINLSSGIITVLLVFVFILAANILRRKVRLFRRSLMPTAVIAGLMGLVIKETVLAITGFNIFNVISLESMVYHMLPVGFIALCLRERDYKEEPGQSSVKYKRVPASRSGALIISTYLLQGLLGIIISIILALAIPVLSNLNGGTGIMLALGFGQGPQQANATGLIWDAAGHMDNWGTGSAKNYWLTIAAMGFLWASIPGIFMINRIAKKKGLIINKNEFQKSGELLSYTIEGPDEVPLSESIDKFSLQVCMVGGIYLLTIIFIMLIEIGFRLSGIPFLIGLIPTFWGFSFMLAALVAIITRGVLRKFVKKGVMHRVYPNNYMLSRIAGSSFDLSICAALFLVSISALGTLWIPVMVITTLGGILTAIYLRRVCNHVFEDYKDEAFMAFYGMQTGTIANGMILLREIDNSFKTPAGDDLVAGSAAAIILGVPMLILIAQAPVPGNLLWVTVAIALYLFALLAFVFKNVLFGKKAKKA